jgi:hypothetical protein
MLLARRPTRRPRFSAAYLRYIRSPIWAARSRAYRDLYPTCQVADCTNPSAQVHHLTYVRLGHERPGDLLAVCVSCHRKIHGR